MRSAALLAILITTATLVAQAPLLRAAEGPSVHVFAAGAFGGGEWGKVKTEDARWYATADVTDQSGVNPAYHVLAKANPRDMSIFALSTADETDDVTVEVQAVFREHLFITNPNVVIPHGDQPRRMIYTPHFGGDIIGDGRIELTVGVTNIDSPLQVFEYEGEGAYEESVPFSLDWDDFMVFGADVYVELHGWATISSGESRLKFDVLASGFDVDEFDDESNDVNINHLRIVGTSGFAFSGPDRGFYSADFQEDHDVDGADLTNWTAGFGPAAGALHVQGDATGDGAVDGTDLLAWQRQLGAGASGSSAAIVVAPEPAGFLMIAGALAALVPFGRRRH